MDNRFTHIVGTGGIGHGVLFDLLDDVTIGRNESRLGILSSAKDFCKQHIILHYPSVLIKELQLNVEVFPIGKLGRDEAGEHLYEMLDRTGMNTEFVNFSDKASTLYSVCFQYPDKSGGNITTARSASDDLTPQEINNAFDSGLFSGSNGIALAAPEVPIDTRIALLKNGRNQGYLNVASLLSAEVAEWEEKNAFALVDILAINVDEANRIAGTQHRAAADIAPECYATLSKSQPSITVIITDGPKGVYTCTGSGVTNTPVVKTEVISTAGAGDAFLGGLLAGLCMGLDLFGSHKEDLTAVELGMYVASISVRSEDTINFGFNLEKLIDIIRNHEPERAEHFLSKLSY